jgi:porphobilinogen synthase
MSVRPRRLRASAALRAMVAETVVRPEHLVWPTFVVDGHDRVEPIASLPRVARRSVDRLLPELERALSLGVRSVMLFGVVDDAARTPWARPRSTPRARCRPRCAPPDRPSATTSCS